MDETEPLTMDRLREELRMDRTILPDQLDVEAARQADVMFNWAERSVAARDALARAKFRLETIEGRLQMRCRESPEEFGIKGNPTETAIKSAVKCSKKYASATERYWEAKSRAVWMDQAVAAMEQRKRMLEALIRLHGQEYFAGPSVPRDLVSAFNEYQTKRTAETDERQRKTARKRREAPEEIED